MEQCHSRVIVATGGDLITLIPLAVVALLSYPWLLVELVELRLMRVLTSDPPRR